MKQLITSVSNVFININRSIASYKELSTNNNKDTFLDWDILPINYEKCSSKIPPTIKVLYLL